MTALATVANAPVLNHGNWERYMVALKGHEEWVFNAKDYWFNESWWEIDPSTALMNIHSKWQRTINGWMKIEGADAVNFNEHENPFFDSPNDVYKMMRKAIRRNRHAVSAEQQREAWAWAQENLVVYKFTLNLITMQSTKEVIDFRKDCCPRNITTVSS